MACPDKVQHIIQSKPFEAFMERFRRGLTEDDEDAFDIPNLLKGICKVNFIHNKDKAVEYKKIPKNTLFVGDVDDFLEYFNPIVKKETKGYFHELDRTTERNMRVHSFRSALVAFFYLEGFWRAEENRPRIFYNQDGTTKTVEFIEFFGVRVIIADGKLKAHVNYVTPDNNRIRNRVCFTMPVDSSYKDGIYENSLLIVPMVDLEYRREEMDGFDTTIINFKYLHNKYGFKAVGMYSRDSADGCDMISQKFVLDKPFKICIHYKMEAILKVCVENLNG